MRDRTLYSENMFLVFHKYVNRQDENMLSQSFMLLFNKSPAFRKKFCEDTQFGSHLKEAKSEDLRINSQVHKTSSQKKSIVDLLVYDNVNPQKHIALIEVKLQQRMTQRQLNDYQKFLDGRKRESKAQSLIVLTVHEPNVSVKSVSKKDTLWINWAEVFQIALLVKSKVSAAEKMIVRDFCDLLNEKGIIPMRTITKSKLAKTVSWIKESKDERYIYEATIHSIEGIINRLVAMRNDAWTQEISKNKKETWGSVVYYSFNQQEIESTCYAGYRKNGPKKWQKRREIGLRLMTEKNEKKTTTRLEINGRNTNTDLDVLKKYTPQQTAKLFSLPIHEANKEISKDMADAYKKYRKSRKD